jgi:hypothetical protein
MAKLADMLEGCLVPRLHETRTSYESFFGLLFHMNTSKIMPSSKGEQSRDEIRCTLGNRDQLRMTAVISGLVVFALRLVNEPKRFSPYQLS